MSCLSFDSGDNGTPIAIARNGEYDGKVLYLHTSDVKTNSNPKYQINALKVFKGITGIKPAEKTKIMLKMQEALDKGIEPEKLIDLADNIKIVYSNIYKDAQKHHKIELPGDSVFSPIPPTDPDKRFIAYLAGASGSGKSYMARTYVEAYRKLYPKRPVYLVSKLQEDETLDNTKGGPLIRIPVESIVNDYPDIDELENSLIVFDDYDTLPKKEGDIILNLIEDICTMGRHKCISLILCSHRLNDYKRTRIILSESHYIVVYPNATSYKPLCYLLENYGGLDKENIKELKKLGRWVLVHRMYPQYILSNQTCNLPHTQ
jgi:hypothetical protein